MDRRDFDKKLVARMASVLGKEIGNADVPSLSPDLPYAIVYPLFSPPPDGSWAAPEEDFDLVYQMTSVGSSPEQSGWMSKEIWNFLLARGPNGSHTEPLGLVGFTVQWRRSNSLGAILPSGDHLFQVDDGYRLKVSQDG